MLDLKITQINKKDYENSSNFSLLQSLASSPFKLSPHKVSLSPCLCASFAKSVTELKMNARERV